MNRTAHEILEDAQNLAPGEVDWLIENLLIRGSNASMIEADMEIEKAWDDEIKHRLAEIDTGAVTLIPGEQIRAEILATLSKQARIRLGV